MPVDVQRAEPDPVQRRVAARQHPPKGLSKLVLGRFDQPAPDGLDVRCLRCTHELPQAGLVRILLPFSFGNNPSTPSLR